MNHEQQIEDLQRELIRVERENRILREANAVAGEQLRSHVSNAEYFLHMWAYLLAGAIIHAAASEVVFPWY